MRNRTCPSLIYCVIILFTSLFANQLCWAFLLEQFDLTPKYQSFIRNNSNNKDTISVKSFFRKKQSTCMMMSMEKQRKKKLVLVGGGHAHLQVIKALRNNNEDGWEVTVVDVQTHASYSGMIPGCVAQWYKEEETQIDLQPLVQEWANATFLGGHTVVDIDLDQKHIVTISTTVQNDGETNKTIVPFDIVSLDIGSTVRSILGRKNHHPLLPDCVIPTRPISHLIQRLEQLEQTEVFSSSSLNQKNTKNVFVVGGGAAGIELSMALRQRWKKYHIDITILDSNTQLLPNENDVCRQALLQQLKRFKIHIRHNTTVTNVTTNTITTTTTTTTTLQKEEPCTVCIWATGAAPHSLTFQLQKRGLAVSEKGWIQVNPSLQSISHPDCVYAAGDCVTIVDPTHKIKSPPKAGVYAVRSGPILIQNLLLQQQQQKEQFVPQDDFLKILMCGDGTALAFRFGIPLYGPWVWQLKHHIDTLFMNLFHPSTLQKESTATTTTNGEEEASQYDDDVPSTTKTPLQAAQYLLRTDENVNYMEAWSILRSMMSDSTFKTQVLQSYHSLLSPSPKMTNIQ